jgi:uncharacterized protein (TIGR02246 family)
MKQFSFFKSAVVFMSLLIFTIGCKSAADEPGDSKAATGQSMTSSVDPVKLKAEIQELETAWAKADNARDVNAIAAYYADDAITMDNNNPMSVGKEAIKKSLEAGMAKKAEGSTITYDVLDVFGGDNYVTEVGKSTRKDATGKAVSTAKYMAVWEKRNNKWICIRDIGNEDQAE